MPIRWPTELVLMVNTTGKLTLEKEWQPTPVFLPRESHGQRSLVGYSPWGRKESDTTEQLTDTQVNTYSYCITELLYKVRIHKGF